VDDTGDGRGALTAAGLFCGSCGTELPPNSKFCNECGAPLTHATQSAEYKQVTVLFADVVHSMDIASAVGAERLREIMADLVDRAAVVVQRFGGTVDKFTGDGIMAVFGAPVALEHHHPVHPSRSPSALRPGSGRVMAPSASRLLPN
jgi:adenylate cyclase